MSWNLAHGLFDSFITAPILLYLGYLTWARGGYRPTSWLLIAGAGWLATGCAEFVHGIESSGLIPGEFNMAQLAPSSWFAARLVYVVMMFLAWVVFVLRGFNASQILRVVILVLSTLIGFVVGVWVFSHDWVMYAPEAWPYRPYDAWLIVPFVILAILFRSRPSMSYAMGLGAATQLVMSFALVNMDVMFNAAHVFKVASFVAPLYMLKKG